MTRFPLCLQMYRPSCPQHALSQQTRRRSCHQHVLRLLVGTYRCVKGEL